MWSVECVDIVEKTRLWQSANVTQCRDARVLETSMYLMLLLIETVMIQCVPKPLRI